MALAEHYGDLTPLQDSYPFVCIIKIFNDAKTYRLQIYQKKSTVLVMHQGRVSARAGGVVLVMEVQKSVSLHDVNAVLQHRHLPATTDELKLRHLTKTMSDVSATRPKM